MKNKNMKSITLFFPILFLMSVFGYSQPKKAEDIREFIWGENDTYKAIPETPQKWKNESAIVIFDNQNHYYNKSKKSLDNFFLTRRIIKLNDKAAVERFSEFNYPTFVIDGIKEIKTWMGIKIIKPNGEVKEIDVEKEKIKTSTDKAVYYYGFIKSKVKSDQIYKLAIPQLETGDIIDFYIYSYEEYKTDGNYVMDPIETTLNGEYPIMDFLLKLKVENDFFINFNSYNGAPNLEDITKPKQRDKEYQITAKNIEKKESLQWIYPLVEYPAYKFQICFAKSGSYEKSTFAFLSEKEDIVKKNVSQDEILKKFKSPISLDIVEKNIKRYFKDKQYSKEELAKEAYYYMRHFYFNQYIEAAVADNKNLVVWSPYEHYSANAVVITYNHKFLSRYASFLKKNKIPFEIVLTKKRYDGTMNDLLIRKNLEWLIKVNTTTPFYAFPIDNHTMIGWIPSLLEGNDAYSLKYDKKYFRTETIEKVTLPVSLHSNNNSTEISSITFSDDISSIQVEKKSHHKGHNKISEINRRLTYLDYLPEERKKYGTAPFIEFLKKKARKKYEELNNAYIAKFTKEKLEQLEETTETEYGFEVDDYKHQIDKTSRYEINDDFVFTEYYSIKNSLIKKAGSNYIFEVGKLIGSQVAIEEKDKKRAENIYMSYPRSYNNEIRITIPKGYTIAGIDKLNLKVKNETGGFVSEASLKDNTLTITTNKYYKNNYEPNSNWDSMLEFLEASYQFSQEKILLKKR